MIIIMFYIVIGKQTVGDGIKVATGNKLSSI